MGIDYSVYVGPYVKCTNPLVEVESSIRTCTNPVCKTYKNQIWDLTAKYCRECGSPIGETAIKKSNTKVNASELYEHGVKEQLHMAGRESGWEELKRKDAEIDIWIANVKRPEADCGINFDPKSDRKYIDLTHHSKIDSIEQFTDAFYKEITQLREAYGSDNVEVKWGIFNWAQ
jgi:hypothetical protein